MLRKTLFLAFPLGTLLAVLLWGQQLINGSRDWAKMTAPANPASGNLRMFANSSTGKIECLDSAGASCFAANSSPLTFYQLSTNRQNGFTAVANGVRLYAFHMDNVAVTVTRMLFEITTADTAAGSDTCNDIDSGSSTPSKNCYDVGVYSLDGNTLVFHTGAYYWSTTGIKDKVISGGGSASLSANTWYLFAITGSANTGGITASSGEYQRLAILPEASTGSASTAGVLPSTTTVPAQSYNAIKFPYLAFR